MNMDLPQRFWDKVTFDPSGCWLWTAATNGGYGVFGVGTNRQTRRMRRAHRLTYISLVGPIPDGLQLDHLCRVRNCVNPEHLEPVTRKENILRGEGFSAKFARQTHCVNGHLLDGQNTGYVWQNTRYVRRCHACNRERRRRWVAATKAARSAS